MNMIQQGTILKIIGVLQKGLWVNASYIGRTQRISFWTVQEVLKILYKKKYLEKIKTIVGTHFYRLKKRENKIHILRCVQQNNINNKLGYKCIKQKKKKIFQIRYKNTFIFLKNNPKKGICKCCGKRKRTGLHHKKYAYTIREIKKKPNLAIKNTIELCQKCHVTIHNLLRKKII